MTTHPRAPRAENELRGAAKHLVYEVEMFRTPVQYISMAHRDLFLNNLCLEGFAAHARVLLHFLYPHGDVTADDVLAQDYFENPEDWARLRGPELPEALQCVCAAPDREVVQLSYPRLSIAPLAKAWDVRAIYSTFNAVLKLFAETAPKLDRLVRDELAHPPEFTIPRAQSSMR
jgi:hypothetical protein